MNESTDIDTQTARFTEAVRAFTPVSAGRYAKLLPFKDGIAELRGKGASYRLIRELLSTAGMAVSADTIGGFIREVLEQRPPARPNPGRRAVRALSEPSVTRAVPTPSKPQFPFTVAPPVEPAPLEPATPTPSPAPLSAPPTEQSRARGPRIADPTNL